MIEFPNTPTNGDTHTQNGITWIYQDSTWSIINDANFPLEEEIVGTALYNPTMTGAVSLPVETFVDYYGILTGNVTLDITGTPASGFTFVRSLTLVSTTTESLTVPVSWIVTGEYFADGQENNVELKITNYPTVGLRVWCFFNQETV